MILYHFTSVRAWNSIRTEGINPGSTPIGPPAVSLTTDLDSEGHGLTNGEKVYPSDPEYGFLADSAGIVDRTRPIFMSDLKEVAVVVEVDDSDRHLYRFESMAVAAFESAGLQNGDLQDALRLFFASSAVAGSHVLGTSHLSMDQLQEEMLKVANGQLPNKVSTWYLYEGSLPLSLIKGVLFRQSDNTYA